MFNDFKTEVNRLKPQVPKWLQDQWDEREDWINAHCGLSSAMRGCSEQFQSAKQHIMNYELHMRRWQDEIGSPTGRVILYNGHRGGKKAWQELLKYQLTRKSVWGISEASHIQAQAKMMDEIIENMRGKPMWNRVYIDEPIPNDYYWTPYQYDSKKKKWVKRPKQKENKIMKIFGFWKAIKKQAQKVEAMFQAMKWFKMLKYDSFDEEWITNKPDGVPFDFPTMPIPMLAKKVMDNGYLIDELVEKKLDERLQKVEIMEKLHEEKIEQLGKLIDYFFVKDYFDGKDSAGCSYPTFNGLIPRETAEKFEKLNQELIDLTFIEVYYTSGNNAQEHKATITRYEKEVAKFRKTLK